MATLTLISKQKGPDSVLVQDQLQALQSSYRAWGAEAFMRFNIWILTKKADARLTALGARNTRLIPFTYNPIQRKCEHDLAKRNIFLKARQSGYTTYVLLRRVFLATVLNPGTNGFLISQNSSKATEHFRMVKRAYSHFAALDPSDNNKNDLSISLLENLLHTTFSNRKELVFDQLDSTMSIGSGEVEESAQGVTLHHVACSEYARWPGNAEETLANLQEAITLDGTLDIESTPNGAVGSFFEECQRAERGVSQFKFHFHPWWEDPTYRIQTKEEIEDLESDERALVQKYHLDMEQICFRRTKKIALRHNFEEKYPEDASNCFILAGSCFFDKDIVRLRMLELMNFTPVAKFGGGSALIFKKRVLGKKYVIGADTASGKMPDNSSLDDTKRDLNAAKILDVETGEEMGMYMAQNSPTDFALDLVQIGKYFNNAMIAVERGTASEAAEGGTVILTLSEMAYPQIYAHKEWWKRRKQVREMAILEGFPTNKRTRPVALNKLKWFVEENPELIWDMQLLKQMAIFVRDARGIPAAQKGGHDDMVMASAIAHCVRLIMLGYLDPLMMRARYGESDEPEDT